MMRQYYPIGVAAMVGLVISIVLNFGTELPDAVKVVVAAVAGVLGVGAWLGLLLLNASLGAAAGGN